MRRRFMLLMAWFLLVVSANAAAAHVAAPQPADPAIVRPDPLSSSVKVGDTFVVNLYVQDIVDGYGLDVRMCFDPQVIQVQDVDANIPGIQIQPLATFMQPAFVIKREAQNAPDPARAECATSGFIWYAFTQLNPTPPKTGSGAIAAVTFKAVGAGVSPLTVAYHKASDRSGNEIPTAGLDGSVVVAGSKTVVSLPLVMR